MTLDPRERFIIQRLVDALQVALLLADRLERGLQVLASHATQSREPLSKAVEAARELQHVEYTRTHGDRPVDNQSGDN